MELWYPHTLRAAVCALGPLAWQLGVALALTLGLLAAVHRLALPRRASSALAPWPLGHRLAWHEPLVQALLLALPLLLRLPSLLLGDYEQDEALYLAGATTLWQDFRPLVAVDTITSGPLNLVAVLAVLKPLGLPLNAHTIKLVAVVLGVGGVWALYHGFRRAFGPQWAPALVYPLWAWVLALSQWRFAHYSSEHAPLFLLALGIGLGLPALRRPPNRWLALGAGLALGAIPLAKWQVVPMGALVGLMLLVWYAHRRAWAATAWLLLGALLPASLMLAFAAAWGELHDVWTTYVLANLVYAGGDHPASAQRAWAEVAVYLLSGEVRWLVRPLLAVLGLAGLAWAVARALAPGNPRQQGPVPASVLLLAAAMPPLAAWCMAKPGTQFAHYLHLWPLALTLPLALGLVKALGGPYQPKWAAQGKRWANRTLVVMLVLTAGAYLPLLMKTFREGNPATLAPCTPGHTGPGTPQQVSALAKRLMELVPPGERVATWGRAFDAAQAGLPSGVRTLWVYYEIRPGKYQTHYLERYRQDLLTRRPEWLVVNLDPQVQMFGDVPFTQQRMTHYPDLWAVVQARYAGVDVVDGAAILRLKAAYRQPKP